MNVRSIGESPVRRSRAHSGDRSFDWSVTGIGAPEQWPAEWRAALHLCRHAQLPVWLALGEELELIYNDSFAALDDALTNDRIPMPIRVAWQDVWSDRLDALIARALVSERSASCSLRIGGPQPIHVAFSALHDDLGRPIGVFGTAVLGELAEQEVILLLELMRKGLGVRRIDEAVAACTAALPGLIAHHDFVGLYLIDPELAAAVRCGQAGALGSTALPAQLALPEDIASSALWATALAGSNRGSSDATPEPVVCSLIEERGRIRGVLLAGPADSELLQAVAIHAGELIAYVSTQAAAEVEASGERRVISADDFALNLSRQLQAPLKLLMQEIDDLLVAGRVSPDSISQLRIARRRARRLARLVDMLRQLFMFDGQRAVPRLRPLKVAAATRSLCELFRPAFDQAGIGFHVDCTQLEHPAWVDRELWEKIICNLLANALKFTLHGEVRVVLHGSGGELVLTVSDTGCGIHEADMPLVFDRFFAGRARNARSDEGVGVGLSWVRELVGLHDGTIRVASALGQGSSFTVRIPYRRGASPESPEDPLEQVGSYEAPDTLEAMTEWSLAAVDAGASPGTRILIAEGDVQTQTYLKALLGARWVVDVVANADAAVARAIELRPGLILADIETADIDGVDLARRLRETPSTQDIPVILICGRRGERHSIDGLEAGALDYVVKPFSSHELMARVDARLAQAHVRRVEREAREAAEREALMKDQVIALVAHELRTPLSAILGWLQVLRDEGTSAPSRRTKALEVIERNANAQARLLRDLFDVSRMVSGKFELELQHVPDFKALIEPAVDALLPLAQKSELRLELTLADEVGPLLVDPERIHQVIWNLVTNAFKFTPSGGLIRVACELRGGHALLRVSDTGKGISPDFLPHVFESFSQESSGRMGHGLGLGLAITRCIVELHGGTISVDSKGEHQGTAFEVTLPCAAPSAPS
jgi:signal transduction histidine kinase